jgi:hypothetical protein
LIKVRKTQIALEEVWHEGGPARETPLLVGTAVAVVHNPYAGRYVEDVMPFMTELKGLAMTLAARLIDTLGGAAGIESYGKGAIVGEDGELEHGALWHEPGGWSMRELLGGTKAIVPACKTVGPSGTRLMIPLGHVNAAHVRSHFGTASVSIWDAPRRNEIVYALGMATGARIHARCGGLAASAIEGRDGLR